MARQRRQVALVTGANQGIGRAVATALAKQHNYHVIIASRGARSGTKVVDELRAAGHAASSVTLDLTSAESISAAAKAVEALLDGELADDGRKRGLDVLVNNAAVLLDAKWRQDGGTGDPFDLFRDTFLPNVVGAAALTERMIPLLRRAATAATTTGDEERRPSPPPSPPRIVFVSSSMGSIALTRDPSVPWYNIDYKAYDASKAALNVLALNYARILGDEFGAKVNVVCPGLVKTALTGYIDGGSTPEEGAVRVVEMATIGADGPTATFSNRFGAVPW